MSKFDSKGPGEVEFFPNEENMRGINMVVEDVLKKFEEAQKEKDSHSPRTAHATHLSLLKQLREGPVKESSVQKNKEHLKRIIKLKAERLFAHTGRVPDEVDLWDALKEELNIVTDNEEGVA